MCHCQAGAGVQPQQPWEQYGGQAGHLLHRAGGQRQLLLSALIRHPGLGDGQHCHRSVSWITKFSRSQGASKQGWQYFLGMLPHIQTRISLNINIVNQH